MLLSLALPAAAEGPYAPPKLVAETMVDKYSDTLTIPVGVSRKYRFFTTTDDKNYEAVETGLVADGGASISSPDENFLFTVTGNLAGASTTLVLKDEGGNALSQEMTVNVAESSLWVRVKGGEWNKTLDIEVGSPSSVEFGWGTESIFDICSDKITMPSDKITYQSGRLSATAPGDYTLTYNEKTVTVHATAASAEIPVDKLNELLTHSNDSTTDFVNYLRTNWGYKGTGPFTATLPAGDLGSIVWSAALPEKAVFTLQGSSDTENPTTISALSINGGTLCLDRVTLDGITGVTLNEGSGNFTARNCTFNNTDQAFKFTSSNSEKLPLLTLLSGNTFTSPKAVVDNAGTWTFTQGDKPVDLNLRVGVGTKNGLEKDTKIVFPVNTKTVNGEVITIATEDAYAAGWDLKFTKDNCIYTNAYFVYYDEGLGKYILLFDVPDFTTTLSLDKDKSQLTLSSPVSGEYLCVNGEGPVLKETNATTRTLVLTEDQAKYVEGVLMKSPFKAAMVNDNKVDSVQYSSGLLNFDTKTKGTYIIKEVKLPAEEAKVATRLYTISTKDVYPIYHANFMNTLRLTRDGNVKINCKEAGKRAIGIPVESLEAAASKGMTVTLNAKNYSLLLDVAALKSLAQQAKGDRVILQYRSLNHKTMSNVGMASVNSHLEQYPNHVADLAFLVSATSDNESIVDLQMGTVTLTVPFIVLPGTEGYPNENFALMTETESQARKTEIADGNLITVLTDLTEHMVFLEMPVEETVPETTEAPTEPETIPETTEAPTEPPVQVEPEESKGFPIWIPIVLVALAGGGAAAWFLFFRKRKKAAE